MSKSVGIFLLDDEEPIRDLLRETCPEEYQFLGEAATCWEARGKILQIVEFGGMLIVVLDGTLPDGHGEEIADELKILRPDTFVVSYSSFLQDWGNTNFEKSGPPQRIWGELGELISQAQKCR